MKLRGISHELRAATSLPNGNTAGWRTNPNEHARLVTEKKQSSDGKFVPFVKMVKGINREANDAIIPIFSHRK